MAGVGPLHAGPVSAERGSAVQQEASAPQLSEWVCTAAAFTASQEVWGSQTTNCMMV